MSEGTSSGGIAVVGMACRYPGAADVVQLWENILTQRRQFRRFPPQRLSLAEYGDPGMDAADRDKIYLTQAAFIDGFDFNWQERRIPRSTFEVTDIVHWLALDVASRALADAPPIPDSKRSRTGVLLGNIMGGEQARADLLRVRWPFVRRVLRAAAEAEGTSGVDALLVTAEEIYKSVFSPITEDTIVSQLANTIAGRICNYFDFHGGGYVVDGACSSSLIAIATAAIALERGDLDVALAGGVDVSLDIWELVSFSKIRALAPRELAVYDRRANGLMPGEGSGFVVLKRLEDARAAGDRVYAIIRGWGISSDGKGGLTTPSAPGQRIALQRAYQHAPYGPRALSFVEGHGTGTPVGDRIELEALSQVLGAAGESPAEARGCGITSFKSLVGHTKGAAGIGGFLKAAIAVNRRVVPPTANCKEPHPVFKDAAVALYPVTRGSLRDPSETIRAGVSSMGFGGINCHITLESGDPPAATLAPALDERRMLASVQETELFVLAAETPAALAEEAARVRRLADGMSHGELCDLSARLAAEIAPGAVRGAVVASSPEEILKRLSILEEMASSSPPPGTVRSAPQDPVWLGVDVHRERVGFVLPGQGSQRLRMGGVLIERHAWARQLLEEADRVLTAMDAPALTPRMLPPVERARDDAELGAWLAALIDVEVSQPAITLTSILWAHRLERLGVVPSAVCGHSQGEQTAFFLAGAIDFGTAMELAAYTGRSGSKRYNDAPPGTMAILGCGREAAQRIVDTAGGPVGLAEINSPAQVVIAGETPAVERALALAAAESISVRRMPVDNAFHTKVIESGVEYMRRAAPPGAALGETRIPIISSMDGLVVPPGTVPRDHYCRMSLSTVDFIAAVQAMSERADILVEVGAARTLSGLVASCPGSVPCLPVEPHPGRDGDFNALLATLFVSGVAIKWDALCEDRFVRPFVPASEKRFFVNPAERPLRVPLPSARVADHGSASALAAATKLAPELVERYLATRGGFLARVITADLEHTPFAGSDAARSVDGDHAARATAPKGAAARTNGTHATNGAHATNGTHGASAKQAGTGHDAPGSRLSGGILARLYVEVAQSTGFAAESLTRTLRLLDDLNLDSLRAGEIIGRVAKAFGADGAVDPSAFANARLEEVEAAIRAAAPHAAEAEADAPQGTAPHAEVEAPRVGTLTATHPTPKLPAEPCVFPFSAASEVALLAAVREARVEVGTNGGVEPASFASRLAHRPLGGAFRAAVVATTTDELRGRLETLARRLASHASARPAVDDDPLVFSGVAELPARVGYLFPGQGSQKVGMAHRLIERHGWARRTVATFDAWLHAGGGETVGDKMNVDPAQLPEATLRALREGLRRTDVTQPAVCLASILWLRELERFGVTPSAVCGHSLGELAALHAAGALDEEAVLHLAAVRGRACALLSPRGTGAMASLSCSLTIAREIVAGVSGYAVVANVNGPRQVVVSGELEGVEEALRAAQTRGVSGQRLPVSNAFHSDLVTPAAAYVREHARVPASFDGPRATFLSSVDGRPLAAGADLREHLARQLLAPVDFVATVEAMAQCVDLMIEVGTGRTLTGLADTIVPASGPRRFTVEGEPGRAVDLSRVLATLFVHGHDIRWGALAADAPDAHAAEDHPAQLDEYVTELVGAALVPAAGETGDWRGARWAVLHGAGEASVAEAIVEHAKRAGAEASAVALDHAAAAPGRDRVTHTVLVLPRAAADEAHDAESRLRGWIEHLRAAASLLPVPPKAPKPPVGSGPSRGVAYVQFGGGHFGLGSEAGSEECWATAHAASVHHEQPGLRVRVLDFDPRERPATIAARIFDEMAAPGAWAAAGWGLDGVRRVPRAARLDASTWPARPAPLGPADVVLVTGGAKGISAECALALARASGAHVALAGRSPVTEPEVAGTLERFAAEDLRASYHVVDVARAADVARLVAEVARDHGAITAVVHGAGANRPGRVDAASTDAVAREVGPKVLGLLNLFDALAATPPRLFIAFTSVIGIAGMAGNAWYAFSNEAVDLLLQRYGQRTPGVSVVSMAFGLWSDVGMGAQEATQRALKRLGLGERFIRPRDGVERFLRLVERDPGQSRVAVTFDLSVLDTWRAVEPSVVKTNGVHAAPVPATMPLLDEILVADANRRLVARIHASWARQPWLEDHVINGAGVWPAVMSLEAMAEACALVTGRTSLECFRGEDVLLHRPILIDPGGETAIEVSVEVLSPETPGDTHLRATLRAAAGPASPAVEGIFVIPAALPPPEHVEVVSPRVPLNVDPDADLYDTGLLFHGARFRRLREVYAMSEQRCAFAVEERAPEPSTRGFLLGDAFFRDGVLQSGTLMLLPMIALPTSLGTFEIRPRAVAEPTRRFGSATLDYVDEREGKYTVRITDADGLVLEKYAVAKVRFRGRASDLPTTRALEDSAARNDWRLRRDVQRLGRKQAAWPALALVSTPGIHALDRHARHELERAPLSAALGRLLGERGAEVSVTWTDAGAPVATRDGGGDPQASGNVSVSVSHTDDLCLCVAGRSAVGCDIMPIESRTREAWIELLGAHRASILDELAADEPVPSDRRHDLAGARIWAAVEAARKIELTPEIGLSIRSRQGAAVELAAIMDDRAAHVLTLPLRPERPSGGDEQVMVALALLDETYAAATAVTPPRAASYDPQLFSLGVDELPGREHVFRHRFPLGMRDRVGPTGRVRFTNFHTWMGKVRELAVLPIFDRIAATLSTGNFGMVTNRTELMGIVPAIGGDAIECHLRIAHASEEAGVIDILYDWYRVNTDGSTTLVAMSSMRTSWVRVLGHGVVKAEPLPGFFADFVLAIPRASAKPHVVPSSMRAGHELCRAPRRAVAPSLYEEEFQTTIEDGNLVGNIYFDRYAIWQSKVRDTWFFRRDPRLVAGSTPAGEWFCTGCRIEHLREAMPFDRVAVSMSVRSLSECGVGLEFNYYRVEPSGERQKLAVSSHDAVWAARDAEGALVAARVPESFRAALLDSIGAREQMPEQDGGRP